MNMHNKFTTKQIQDTLHTLDQPALDLESAKSRVWHKLADSTINHNPKPMPQPQPKFWQNPAFFPVLTATFSTIIIIAAGVVILSQSIKQNNLASKSNSSSISSLSGQERTLPPGTSLDKNKTPLQNFRTLAAERFVELTGTTYEEFTSIEQNTGGATEANKPAIEAKLNGAPGIDVIVPKGTASGGAGNGGALPINPERAAELAKRDDNRNRTTYYNKLEMIGQEYVRAEPYSYLSQDSSSSQAKLIKSISQNWYSSDYTKSVSVDESNRMAFYIATPEYNLLYADGKFAIKNIYDIPNYFAGFSGGAGSSLSNYEVEFLKSLLNNPSIQDKGIVSLDGKSLRLLVDPGFNDRCGSVQPSLDSEVTQSSFSGSNSGTNLSYSSSISTEDYSRCSFQENSTRTNYYVDESKFVMYLTESFTGDQLNYSTKVLESIEYKDSDPIKFFNTDEIKNIPIREFDQSLSPKPGNELKSFNQNAPIVLPVDYNPSSVYTYSYDKSYNLSQTRDFDPTITQEYEQYQKDQPIGFISFLSPDSSFTNIEIYDQKPDPSKPIYGQGGAQLGDYTIMVNRSPILTESFSNVYSQASLVFEFQGKWIKANFNASDSNYKGVENLKLVTLTSDQITQLDKERKDIFDNTPVIYTIDLDSSTRAKKLLPGDLTKNYQLELQSLSQPSKDYRNCDNYISYEYIIPDCLAGKYGGFGAYFQSDTFQSEYSQIEYSNLQWVVLSQQLSESEINQTFENFEQSILTNSSSPDNKFTYSIETKNQYYKVTYRTANDTPDYVPYDSVLYFFDVGDQTVIVSGMYNFPQIQYDSKIKNTSDADIRSQSNEKLEKEIIKIVNNSAINKDLDILKAQLEEYLY